MNTKPILGAGAILGAFAIAGVGLVVVTNFLTEERIAANLREAMLDKFSAILPTAPGTEAPLMDNDPLADRIQVSAPDLLGALERVGSRDGAGGTLGLRVPDELAGHGRAEQLGGVVGPLALQPPRHRRVPSDALQPCVHPGASKGRLPGVPGRVGSITTSSLSRNG